MHACVVYHPPAMTRGCISRACIRLSLELVHSPSAYNQYLILLHPSSWERIRGYWSKLVHRVGLSHGPSVADKRVLCLLLVVRVASQ